MFVFHCMFHLEYGCAHRNRSGSIQLPNSTSNAERGTKMESGGIEGVRMSGREWSCTLAMPSHTLPVYHRLSILSHIVVGE